MTQHNPKAFISHSSKDKDRFARPLREALEARGVGTWFDERDLLPGDKLVDKIFREGITESDAFVVVLSENTVDSRWVEEELDVAVVHRIAGAVKVIIPVLLDGVTPPPSLAATVWERVPDVGRPDRHFDRIAAAILGRIPVARATPPPYTQQLIHGLPDLEAIDEIILRFACEILLLQGWQNPFVGISKIYAAARQVEVMEDDFGESLEALKQHGYFSDGVNEMGSRWPVAVRVTSYGLDSYLRHYKSEEYASATTAVVSAIVNENVSDIETLIARTGVDGAIADHVLHVLADAGDLHLIEHLGGIAWRAKETLRRRLR